MMRFAAVVAGIFFFFMSGLATGNPALSESGLIQTMKMMKNLCKRTHPIKQEYLNRVKDEGVFIDDPKFKCYIHCVLGMMKVIRRDQITPVEATKQAEALLPESHRSLALKQLNLCKDVQGIDACDLAYNFAKCAYDVEPTNLMIPI